MLPPSSSCQSRGEGFFRVATRTFQSLLGERRTKASLVRTAALQDGSALRKVKGAEPGARVSLAFDADDVGHVVERPPHMPPRRPLHRPLHSVGATMKCASIGLVGTGSVRMRVSGRQNRGVPDFGLRRSRATAPLAPLDPLAPLANTRPSRDPSVPRQGGCSPLPGSASPSSASATTTPYLVPHRRVPLQQPSAVCLDTDVSCSRKAPFSCPCPPDDCSQPPSASAF
jgi:hypothetical protein